MRSEKSFLLPMLFRLYIVSSGRLQNKEASFPIACPDLSHQRQPKEQE
jgi:hypothetical protein